MRRSGQGFTLVELLVALALLALIAALAARVTTDLRASHEILRHNLDETGRLQSGIAQWVQDLDGAVQIPGVLSFEWDGRSLRLVRLAEGAPMPGYQVVTWARQDLAGVAHWARWRSPVARTRDDLVLAWAAAQRWAQRRDAWTDGEELMVMPAATWGVFFFRGNAWSHALSSPGSTEGSAADRAAAGQMPDGVRLILDLKLGQHLQGQVTRDWVNPSRNMTLP